MHRPTHYSTKQGTALLAYLASVKDLFVTASQIARALQQGHTPISRPTVYRQLDRLVSEGKVRKYIFDGSSVCSFQYIDPNDNEQDAYPLKCEICDGVFSMRCGEVDHMSRHILETHAFQVNGSKTVFYGTCKTCLKK